MAKIKRMSVKEFREKGFLQELNRQFLHPLGLAIEVVINEEDGSEKFGEVWDYTDDPEGIIFKSIKDRHKIKADKVKELFEIKSKVRLKNFGYIIQPIDSNF